MRLRTLRRWLGLTRRVDDVPPAYLILEDMAHALRELTTEVERLADEVDQLAEHVFAMQEQRQAEELTNAL